MNEMYQGRNGRESRVRRGFSSPSSVGRGPNGLSQGVNIRTLMNAADQQDLGLARDAETQGIVEDRFSVAVCRR
jgi:hypothetical protein